MSECVRVRVGVSSVFLSSVLLDIFSICHLLRIYGMDGNMDCWRENNKKKIPTRISLCVPSSDQKVNILWKITKNERTLDFFWNLLLRISWKDDSCFYCGWFVCHHFRIQNWIPSIVLLYKKTTPTHWCSHHRLFLFVWLKIRNCVFFSNVYIFIFIPRPNEMNNLRYPTAGFLF